MTLAWPTAAGIIPEAVQQIEIEDRVFRLIPWISPCGTSCTSHVRGVLPGTRTMLEDSAGSA